MSERPLLDALAELAREERELEQRADPQDAALFQPLTAEKKAELAKKVRDQLGMREEAAVSPFRARRWPWLIAIAASVLVVAISGRSFFSPAVHAPLPPYALSISSGVQEERIDSAPAPAIPTFAPNTTLQVILRPERAISGTAAFRAFLVRGDRWIAWSPPSTIDASGSIFIEGRTSALLHVEPGPWTLVFVLGHPDTVEDAAKEVASGARAAGTAIVLEQKIVVVE